MIKINKKYYQIVLRILIAVFLFCHTAVSQQTDYANLSESELNNDPFAELTMGSQPYAQENISSVPIIENTEPNLFIETIVLKFLDAESLMQIVEKMNSVYGKVSINEKNNSLIVCDSRERLDRILEEIRKADKTPQQIMIEVVIVDVQLNDDTEIGVNWDILSSDRYDYEYRQNFSLSRIGTTVEDATTIGNGSAFNTTGLGGAFSIISSSVRNVLNLIQQKRDVKILASPRVMMVSGEQASIEAIEEIPYTEVIDTAGGGAGALTTTSFKNVGIKLKVQATITDSNNIFLLVDTEQNVTSGQSDTEIPIVDTRKATTSLMLRDAQTVIFGGLRRQEKTKEVSQIPILGDIPIIGFIFKSTNTITKNSELIVFLSPRIYKGEPVGDDEMKEYKKITEKPMISFE
ncbi:MAG: hypothetical protein JXA96_10545 [Sedimentisphaerales bacterium]|nr:hypothetical protein [Sedimentisphaerales bacterium]